MSKLPNEYQFIDLSDYGRPVAKIIANYLKNSAITPIHVTLSFVLCGIMAIVCILYNYFWATAVLLIMKSILDAADGELARLNRRPSYTGRYLDSVSDIILNIFILLAIWHISDGSLLYTILAVIGLQLQGTLYNYYYVILRNKFDGDTTSRIFEKDIPTALKGEKQQHVTILFKMYRLFYGIFDYIIYQLDSTAKDSKYLPKWFMTAVSTFGLGFQLLLIGLMLVLNLTEYIIPFFIIYSAFIFVFIGIRRFINR
jgi:hypothetical protein